LLSGSQVAPTAEALMRSRYTAYSFKNVGYILKTISGRVKMYESGSFENA